MPVLNVFKGVYYPFGLQTASSWTRENSVKNDYLYNEGNELNSVTGWYETMFRGYDPAIGRFQQIDPLAVLDHSRSPYGYGRNNPVLFNDPLGLLVNPGFPNATWNIIEKLWDGTPDDGIGYWSDNQYHYFNGGGEVPGPGSNYQPGTAGGSIRPVFDTKAAWEYVASARGAGDEESYPTPPIGFEFVSGEQSTPSLFGSFTDTTPGSNNDPLSGQNDRSLVGHGGASVILNKNGDVKSWDSGANNIFVDLGDGNVAPFRPSLVVDGKMEPKAFANGLLSIVDGTTFTTTIDGETVTSKFDRNLLHNGEFSLAIPVFEGRNFEPSKIITYNDGNWYRAANHVRMPGGFHRITYSAVTPLTVNNLRAILFVHEFFGHGIRELDNSDASHEIINKWVGEYLKSVNR